MATTLQHRRGTATEADAFVGLEGEFFIDSENKNLRISDGSTAGGTTLVNSEDLANGLSLKIEQTDLDDGLATKQDTLVDNTNIVTINGSSLLGTADLTLVEAETITVLELNGNSLDFTDENGTVTNIDLSAYLDDTTNTITGATLTDTTVEFTREDLTTFSIDLADLIAGKVDLVASTDEALVRFNGTNGQVQDSLVLVDDAGNMTVNSITLPNLVQANTTTSVNVTDATIVATLDSVTTKTAKLLVEINDTISSEVEITELFVAFDGVTPLVLENTSAKLFTGLSELASFSINYNDVDSLLEIISTQPSSNTCEYKITTLSIK